MKFVTYTIFSSVFALPVIFLNFTNFVYSEIEGLKIIPYLWYLPT